MRSRQPSGKIRALNGDELEELIESDSPLKKGASGPGGERAPGSTPAARAPGSSPAAMPPTATHRTGPGLGAERTEQIKRADLEQGAYDVDLSGMEETASPTSPPSQDRIPTPPARPGARQHSSGAHRQPMPATTPPPSEQSLPPLDDEKIDELLGEVLGSYRLLSIVGEGGMGRVYLAEHIELGRKVALKLLRPEYSVRRDAVRRFFQEARAVNRIGHENIVDITDLVKLPTGHTFIIMELLQGEDLAEIQKQCTTPMPLERAMRIAMQVCDALEAAHGQDVIHRDMKPDNIFIVNDGKRRDFVKLLDFGVAKLLHEEENDGWKTAVGSVIGTPAYMSPEQATGIPVDRRSDIYSLGAIMYELFTGHPVFRAKSFGEFVVKHMNDEPVPPRELADAPKIPATLEAVILRCLEKDPAKRYQTVIELRDDLARATATVETVIKPSPMAADKAPTKRKTRWLYFVPVFLGVAILALLVFWLASGLSLDDVTPPGDPPKVRAAGGPRGGAASKAGAPAAAPTERQVEIKLTLLSQPAGAAVTRKDQPDNALGKTPLTLDFERVGEEVEFVFTLGGHTTTTQKITVTETTVVSVALRRKASRPVRAKPEPARADPEPVAPKPAALPKPKPQEPKPAPRVEPKPPPAEKRKPKRRPKPKPKAKPKKKPVKVDPMEQIDPFAM